MDVADLVRRLLRRRWSVLLVVVLAIAAAGAGWRAAGSSHEGGAAVVIVPPLLGDAVSEQNPLLNLDNNLSQLAVVLSGTMNSPSATGALDRLGATAPFTTSTVTGTNPSFAQLSPEVVFTVTGPDAALVRRTAAGLVTVARRQLAALQEQAGVRAGARASLVEVVAPTGGDVIAGGRLRSAGVLGLAVVVVGLLAVLLLDEVQARRGRWRVPAPPASRPRRRRWSGRRGVAAAADGDDADDDGEPALRSR